MEGLGGTGTVRTKVRTVLVVSNRGEIAVICRPGYVREVTDSGALRIACSLGTPVVATADGGVREFLENAVTSRLVPPGDPQALVQALCELLGVRSRPREWQ